MAEKIVYYAGCFANYYNPEIGKALIEVMKKSGIEVMFPEQKCCGMPMMANGNLKGAEKNVRFNFKSLALAASPGYDIITTCPSCNLMLRRESLAFFDTEEARFVSENIYDAGEYLMLLHRQGRLNTDFGKMPIKIFYHNPCHLKLQNITQEPVALLKLIPGLVVSRINTYCCGMGGSYGMKKNNYNLSAQIAKKVWGDVKASEADRVVTECGGCKLQIEAGTGIEAVHPLILLDEAYKSF
ncbi:MAG: hypothetical protein DRG50_00585 [Deltaproteobacteria bacterium]|nr:MAG: hypothetical protein DRG50_00585 [Deltaproteobacteria bacterium]